MVRHLGDPPPAAIGALVIGGLAVTTGLVFLLENMVGLPNASAAYLVTVTVAAVQGGTVPAMVSAIGAVLTYNVLFVEPRGTLAVGRPEDLLTLALLLFVGAVIGRLAGIGRAREQDAERRERETRALFAMSRDIVTSGRLADAIGGVVERLAAETAMRRVWVALGATIASERSTADSDPAEPRPTRASHMVLRRDTVDAAAKWIRVHPAARVADDQGATSGRLYRVELRTGDEVVGSLWSLRDGPDPSLEETRLLAAAADQLGAAVGRDRLQAGAAELEIARRSEELKSALLESVSHDLRTPLAAIRAAAGTLADEELGLDAAEQRALARGIDEEAERMNRLVGDLLDMGRIQGGALVADIEIVPLDALVGPAIDRARRTHSSIALDIPADLPPVRADAALLDRVLANLLDNAAKFAGPRAPIRVAARTAGDEVIVRVEDGGPGVRDDALGRIFERFVRDGGAGPRPGFGLGLAVVRGLVEAMGGRVTANRSDLGGLAVDVTLAADRGASV